jgi:hypothetical protein
MRGKFQIAQNYSTQLREVSRCHEFYWRQAAFRYDRLGEPPQRAPWPGNLVQARANVS